MNDSHQPFVTNHLSVHLVHTSLVPMNSKFTKAVLLGGLIGGAMDITAATTVSAIYGRPPLVVLQSVASGLLGNNAYNGGAFSAALGLALHFLIATIWAFIYCALKSSLPFPKSSIITGLIYGIIVYCIMNFVVLPLSAFPHEVRYTIRGLLIIMFCIGLPIAFAAKGLQKSQKVSIKGASL
jgi:hypothetical protein